MDRSRFNVYVFSISHAAIGSQPYFLQLLLLLLPKIDKVQTDTTEASVSASVLEDTCRYIAATEGQTDDGHQSAAS